NVGGVYVLGRWVFRLRRSFAAAGSVFAAVTCGPLWFSAYQGFFCQVFGTAALAMNLALLTRLAGPGQWRTGNAVLLGLSLAIQLSMYSELAPVLGLVCLAQWLVTFRRASRSGQARSWLRFTAVTVGCMLVGANVEFYRAILGACYKMENHVYGWPHPWSD